MRELQTYGRYFLYTILFVCLLAGLQHDPVWFNIAVIGMVVGVPGYWFWTRSVHNRDHLDRSVDSCSHCRDRFTIQNQVAKRSAREAEMDRLNQRFRD